MALSLPAPKPLDKGEDFEKCMDSIEIYLAALNITKEVQRKSIVLHLLGPRVQEIYKNLPDEEDDSDSYASMKRKLTKYFKPASNPVVERHIFNQMKYECSSVE